MDSDRSKSGIQVVSRAASVLRSLKDQHEGLSLGQIAERVGLPRSTVQRIVGALQAERFVISAQPGRGIRLGPELNELAQAGRMDIVEILRPYLGDLAKKTSETIDLAMLQNGRMVFIHQIPSMHRLRAVSSVGDAFPLTTTANGKACLAKLPDKSVLKFLSQEQPLRFADKTQRVAYSEEIKTVRQTGIAFDRDEHTAGISAIGMSLHDTLGNLYAISIPTPSSRFASSEPQIEVELRATMARLDLLEVVADI